MCAHTYEYVEYIDVIIVFDYDFYDTHHYYDWKINRKMNRFVCLFRFYVDGNKKNRRLANVNRMRLSLHANENEPRNKKNVKNISNAKRVGALIQYPILPQNFHI